METMYLAGGCLWGMQAYMKTLPGVIKTEAGRANGTTDHLDGPYDGYTECVKTVFDESKVSVEQLMAFFFEAIDPYSLNKQGIDVGEKYRTGVYSEDPQHLDEARSFIDAREDSDRVLVEVKPLTQYVRSAEEHQDRLDRHPNDYCHIPKELLDKHAAQIGSFAQEEVASHRRVNGAQTK